jgi:hypothetical protein
MNEIILSVILQNSSVISEILVPAPTMQVIVLVHKSQCLGVALPRTYRERTSNLSLYVLTYYC